jgi:hypothetical protein
MSGRADFRGLCVLSIDQEDCPDRDDCLHVATIGPGRYQVRSWRLVSRGDSVHVLGRCVCVCVLGRCVCVCVLGTLGCVFGGWGGSVDLCVWGVCEGMLPCETPCPRHVLGWV